ncbi:SNF1-related protein kinase regulatory subunit gamma-like PV42a [Acorus gramineus]|uniref:SNF1-related protein kinase regulatory subunit gamma-like PV42a n=1 Tax=Acorus gramineus TaxID=55184 RepID=A0AAV9AXX4_ACOGR|nr:SNF1-related protein kinase regulatory subunit gamma-like PV42a [Acorus gramineus]
MKAAAEMKATAAWLRGRTVRDLVAEKRRLVEVPYTATLSHTMNALLANNVVAVPVAAPPGHWIGAGGSMILESDRVTGAVRKHYIGMVTMLDILSHIAEFDRGGAIGGGGEGEVAAEEEEVDVDEKMSVPVSSVIGHSLEGLSLWTLNPNTSILDCMEAFSKGVHRALVPLDSHSGNVAGVELAEAASAYRMLTQMDVLRFLKTHDTILNGIMLQTVEQLGAINEDVFCVTKNTSVIEAIKWMRSASLTAVPIIEASEPVDDNTLINGKGRKLISTFTSTDLRGCPTHLLQSWLSIGVEEFKERVSELQCTTAIITGDLNHRSKKLVTCYADTILGEVIKEAIDWHMHRVWVVDQHGLLVGLISLTDMLRVVREAALAEEDDDIA